MLLRNNIASKIFEPESSNVIIHAILYFHSTVLQFNHLNIMHSVCELEQYSFVQKYLQGKLFWKEAYTSQYFPHDKPSAIRILVFHFICFHMNLTSKS